MAISTLNLPLPVGTSKIQSGFFTTDATGELTAALTTGASVNAATLTIPTTAGFIGGEFITVPGAGYQGVDQHMVVLGASLQAAGQLSVAVPGIVTGVASGTVVTRWNRVACNGQPKHVRATRRDNGDYYDWVAGMEPFSANTSIGGVIALLAKVMLCHAGAVHFAPGMLAPSQTYDIVIDY